MAASYAVRLAREEKVASRISDAITLAERIYDRMKDKIQRQSTR
jgi:hypothetical protein